jgi:LysR family transcriptional regulator, glycine cleavage system transcriptional activator
MAKLNLPPLNAVRAFEAAARRGSFEEAAADLSVTHWAIGKQIRQLEDWLGVPLFERRSSGVTLTAEGAELSGDVSAVLSRLSEAAGKLRRPEVTRRVSGLVQPSFALRWLFPRMARFQELFPNNEVRVKQSRHLGARPQARHQARQDPRAHPRPGPRPARQHRYLDPYRAARPRPDP